MLKQNNFHISQISSSLEENTLNTPDDNSDGKEYKTAIHITIKNIIKQQ